MIPERDRDVLYTRRVRHSKSVTNWRRQTRLHLVFKTFLRCPANVNFAYKRLKQVSQTSSSPKLTKDVFITKTGGNTTITNHRPDHGTTRTRAGTSQYNTGIQIHTANIKNTLKVKHSAPPPSLSLSLSLCLVIAKLANTKYFKKTGTKCSPHTMVAITDNEATTDNGQVCNRCTVYVSLLTK